MSKARDTATDRLSNIIEVVELGRRTGLLAAERGIGPSFEEGEIYFVGGRALYASLMHLRGRQALTALGQWGPCNFSFDAMARAPIPNIAEAITGPNGAVSRVTGGPSPAPAYATPNTAASPRWSPPSGAIGTMPVGEAPGMAAVPGGSSNVQGQPGRAPKSGPLGRRPRRSPDLRDLMTVVTTHHLSRVQRTILLLADGAHDVVDIARLASRSLDEVTQILSDLQGRGLIYFYE